MKEPEEMANRKGVAGGELQGEELPEGSAGMEFERDLAHALRRVDAPEGFSARLMERAERGKPARAGQVPDRSLHRALGRGVSRLFVLPRRPVLSWASGAIAAMLVAGVFLGQRVHERQERRAAAEREFQTATQITDHALAQVRQQLAQQGIQLNGE